MGPGQLVGNGPSVRRGAEILGSLERWSMGLANEESELRAKRDDVAISNWRAGTSPAVLRIRINLRVRILHVIRTWSRIGAWSKST
jgi:hypothetical protein